MRRADTTIREAMKRAMQEQGLTQAALAEKLGVKQPSVADVLSGRRGVQPESLVKMLEALGLELTVQPKQPEPAAEQLSLAELLERAGPVKRVRGRGRPQGSSVEPAKEVPVSQAVVEERDERERNL